MGIDPHFSRDIRQSPGAISFIFLKLSKWADCGKLTVTPNINFS